MLTVEQKRAFNKLKHDLEGWREFILLVNSILKWDNKFFPGIIFGVVSIAHLILWYLDLSTLTLLSLTILMAVLADYFYPIVSRFLFKADNWTGEQETQFEQVCTEMCNLKFKWCSYFEYLFKAKENRSAVFLIAISITLLLCAWIGSIIDNLFLSYVTTLAVAFYPGLHKHGFIRTVKSSLGSIISSKIQHLNSKIVKTE